MLRRTLVLLGLVVGAALLAMAVRAPRPLTGLEAARGHRVFAGEGAVAAVEVSWGGQHFTARREGVGWRIDEGLADAETSAALDDLAETLGRLRALDAFRAEPGADYGLEHPRGTIAVRRGGRIHRIDVGGINTAGSAFYARDGTDGRMLQVGVGIESSLERVLFSRDRQRPEIG